MRTNAKRNDTLAAILLAGVGGFVVMHGISFELGTLSNMGPGFFPVALGAILILLSALIYVFSSPTQDDAQIQASSTSPAQWRGRACIVAGIVAFIIIGKSFGFVPASFALVFLSALGDREHNLLTAFGLAGFITVVGTVIFSWALGMQFPLFQWR